MTRHDEGHEELLQLILAGDVAEDDARARDQLQECAACRDELERLRALDRELRAVATETRADIARSSAEVSAEDVERVRASFAKPRATRARGPAPRVRPAVWVAAAAALLLVVWGARLFFREPPSAMPELLLGGELECLEPVGAVERYSPFLWEGTPSPLGRYELRIHELVGHRIGKELHSERLSEPRWTPEPELERSLPPRIYWEVRAIDEETGLTERGFASAWRPSH